MTIATNLAGLLRSETKSLHTAAERAGIMPDMLRGRVDRATYCKLLRNFYLIYAALQTALERNASLPLLGAVHSPELNRTTSLATDLHFLHGQLWAKDIPLASAGIEYAQRLNELGDHDPALLAAHAYVRYMGDLSGGQMLRTIIGDALQLADSDGVRFYEFAAPGATALAKNFREGLGSIDLDVALTERIITEAKSAFGRHIDLFNELAQATTLSR